MEVNQKSLEKRSNVQSKIKNNDRNINEIPTSSELYRVKERIIISFIKGVLKSGKIDIPSSIKR